MRGTRRAGGRNMCAAIARELGDATDLRKMLAFDEPRE